MLCKWYISDERYILMTGWPKMRWLNLASGSGPSNGENAYYDQPHDPQSYLMVLSKNNNMLRVFIGKFSYFSIILINFTSCLKCFLSKKMWKKAEKKNLRENIKKLDTFSIKCCLPLLDAIHFSLSFPLLQFSL